MADLANEFSWSRSRDNTFQECRRRYFYHYYGAWGGWDVAAPEEIRRLYILKQLASRQMWAGRVVHDAIEMALHAFADDRELPIEPFIADVVERMRGEWRSSKAARYRDNPKTLALFEHEYAIDLKAEVWQALSRNVT
ncbi:MAG TPA: PD-(D/E)XK nuclease family protein, partial [Methylomirabilota bacterium]